MLSGSFLFNLTLSAKSPTKLKILFKAILEAIDTNIPAVASQKMPPK